MRTTCHFDLGFSTQPPVETQRGGARQGRLAAQFTSSNSGWAGFMGGGFAREQSHTGRAVASGTKPMTRYPEHCSTRMADSGEPMAVCPCVILPVRYGPHVEYCLMRVEKQARSHMNRKGRVGKRAGLNSRGEE